MRVGWSRVRTRARTGSVSRQLPWTDERRGSDRAQVSWEAPPEPRRRWKAVVGVIAVMVAFTAATAALRPGGGSADLRVDGGAADPAGTDLDGSGDGLLRSPLDPAELPTGDPPLPDAPGLTIVIADFGSRLQLIEVSTGARHTVPVFADGSRSRPDALQVIGDDIIFDAGRRVVRLAEGDEGAPQQLARNHRSIPTDDATSVWVYDHFTANLGGVASRVGFDGTVHDRIDLPALAQPIAGTADALIVSTPGTVSRIDVDSGRRQQIARGQALASDGTSVARLDCLGDLSCGVAIGTVDQPDRVRVTLRAGDLPVGLFDVPQARFSPDGRWLALAVYRELDNERLDRSHVAVIDVTLGTEVDRVPGSTLTSPTTPFGWSPDSRWLAVSTGTRVILWSTDRGAGTELPLRVSPTYAVALR